MNFDKHELKLLAAAGALVQPGQPVPLATLAGLFDRPGKLRAVIDQLRLGQFVTFDPFKAELRLLPRPILTVLMEFAQQGVLFTQERPLDDALAAQSLVSVFKNMETCEITHALPAALASRKPPDPPPTDAVRSDVNAHKTAVTDVTESAVTEPQSAVAGRSAVVASRVIPVSGASVRSVGEKTLNTGITGEPVAARPASMRPAFAVKSLEHQLDEQELMTELSALLDSDPKNPDEVKNHGGHWRVNHVRKHPRLLANLLVQLRELIEVNWHFKTNRAAWLESAVKNTLRREKGGQS